MRTYLSTTLDFVESEQIDPPELEKLVVKLRSGDRSVINTIIKGHYRLVNTLISNAIYKKGKAADVEGVGYLALVQAVHNSCPHTDKKGKYHDSRLTDNNITFYITSEVKYAIKKEYSGDHIVRVPDRTVRHKLANGEKFSDIVPGDPGGLVADPGENDFLTRKLLQAGHILPFYCPIAIPTEPSIEFKESLDKACTTLMEKCIIQFRSEGYGYKEVAEKTGFSQSYIGKMVPKIEKRFNAYFGKF